MRDLADMQASVACSILTRPSTRASLKASRAEELWRQDANFACCLVFCNENYLPLPSINLFRAGEKENR